MLARTGVRKISSVAFGFSSVKVHYSVNRINEVMLLFFKYRLKIHKLRLFLLLLYWHGFFDVSVTLCDVSITLSKQTLDVHPRSDSTYLAEAVPIENTGRRNTFVCDIQILPLKNICCFPKIQIKKPIKINRLQFSLYLSFCYHHSC